MKTKEGGEGENGKAESRKQKVWEICYPERSGEALRGGPRSSGQAGWAGIESSRRMLSHISYSFFIFVVLIFQAEIRTGFA